MFANSHGTDRRGFECVCVCQDARVHCSSSRSPQRGRKWACACGPVKPSLSSALAPLPRSASRCGLSGFFSCGLKSASCLCTVSSSLFSSPFSFAVLSSLFMQLIRLMNQYKHKVHFMREIFTGDIKPHITTAQMEQKHMTDRPCSGKKEKSMSTVYIKQLLIPTITVSFCLLLSTCVPAAIKDPGGSNQGITRMGESEFMFKTLNIYLCMFVCIGERKLGDVLRIHFNF